MSVYSGPTLATSNLVFAIDAANQKSYSPNVFRFPTDLYSWATTGNQVTLSRDTIASPVGSTPLKMVVTGNDPYIPTYNSSTWNLSRALDGETWTISVYVKATQATTGQFFIFGADSTGVSLIGGQWVYIAATTFNITTSWTRVSYTVTLTNNANLPSNPVAFIQARLDGPDTGGAGINIWWDGLQLERSSSATPFNSRQNANANSVIDLTSNLNNGSFANTYKFTANSSGGFVFDGLAATNSYINIPYNSTTMDFSKAQTICMWLKPHTGSNTARRNPYNQAYGGPGTITYEINKTFTYYFGTNGENALPYTERNSIFTVEPNEIAMISITRDQTANTFAWFKNGQLIGSTHASYPSVANGTSPIRIGSGYAGYFLGEIYECKVYNRALSAQEIKQYFNAYRGRYGL